MNDRDKMAIVIEAMLSDKLLGIVYDDLERIVEVHACGFGKNGNPLMRVFQIEGEAGSWKLLRFDRVSDLCILDGTSQAPRPGYAQGDKAMAEIVAEVKAP